MKNITGNKSLNEKSINQRKLFSIILYIFSVIILIGGLCFIICMGAINLSLVTVMVKEGSLWKFYLFVIVGLVSFVLCIIFILIDLYWRLFTTKKIGLGRTIFGECWG